jgi:hypothetical protein
MPATQKAALKGDGCLHAVQAAPFQSQIADRVLIPWKLERARRTCSIAAWPTSLSRVSRIAPRLSRTIQQRRASNSAATCPTCPESSSLRHQKKRSSKSRPILTKSVRGSVSACGAMRRNDIPRIAAA